MQPIGPLRRRRGVSRARLVGAITSGAVVFGVGGVYDYNHNPVCVLPMRNCREGVPNCTGSCPGPDVHWALVLSVALLVAALVYGFFAISEHARHRGKAR
jgi:hypothetical protein